MEMLHQPGDTIAQRYRILDILGQGGIGITYKAEDLKSSQKVALKVMSLRRTDDDKVMELFEREARILAQLNHSAIPHYIDYFQINKRRNQFFYLVQQLAEGKSLAEMVEKGWHPDEGEVRLIATQILEILVYLQQLTPPVIHRDIKPQNIVCRDDRRVFLVDFGAVQDVYHNTLTAGSTVAGTYGYMAPEQFRGRTMLATDLYGLGVTLIFLLTQKSPVDLPKRKLKIEFRSQVRITKQFALWLKRMIEPVAEDRFLSAKEALAALQGKKELTRSAISNPNQSSDNPVILMNDGRKLIIVIPPLWLHSNHSQFFALLTLVWNGFLLLMIWMIVASGIIWTAKGVFRPSPITSDWSNQALVIASSIWPDTGAALVNFFLVNWSALLLLGTFTLIGLCISAIFLFSAASRTRLEINQQNFRFQRWFLNWCYREIWGRTEEISRIERNRIGLSMNKSPITVCALKVKQSKYRFGSFLAEPEKEWLVAQVKDFLDKQQIIGKKSG
ncbi:MAG TPA: serine/threonine-protein kinase [Allocoleopsis sp.]